MTNAKTTPNPKASPKAKPAAHAGKDAHHIPAHDSHKPASPTAPNLGRFCWNELMVHDLARAKAFYAASLGWEYEAMPLADGRTYWIIKVPGHPDPVGGLFEMKGPDFHGMPEQWVPYVAVDDVDARLKASVEAGALMCMPPVDIEGVGRMAAIRQPGGAMIYWMKPLMRG